MPRVLSGLMSAGLILAAGCVPPLQYSLNEPLSKRPATDEPVFFSGFDDRTTEPRVIYEETQRHYNVAFSGSGDYQLPHLRADLLADQFYAELQKCGLFKSVERISPGDQSPPAGLLIRGTVERVLYTIPNETFRTAFRLEIERLPGGEIVLAKRFLHDAKYKMGMSERKHYIPIVLQRAYGEMLKGVAEALGQGPSPARDSTQTDISVEELLETIQAD